MGGIAAAASYLNRRQFARAVAGLGLAVAGAAILPACGPGSSPAQPAGSTKPPALTSSPAAAAPTRPAVAGPRIGILWPGAAGPSEFREALLRGLGEHNYVEGQNANLEERFADGKAEQLPSLASELAALKVDVIVTSGTPAGLAAKQATSAIPVVMALSTDPVENGLVASLAQPGGNVTGLTNTGRELTGKRLELLKAVAPSLGRLAVLWNAANQADARSLKEIQEVAQQQGIRTQSLEVRGPNPAFNAAFEAASKEQAGAVIVINDAIIFARAKQIADLAIAQRLPTMYDRRDYVAAGGLLAYGANLAELHRRAADYVDKILKGARPADLPVEQPTKFDLVVNLKTAQALGLTLPQPVLGQATEVLQ